MFSVSQVNWKYTFSFDGITTTDIHETIIKSAADLISEETPDYQYLAARLSVFHLRKKAYGEYESRLLFMTTLQNWLIWNRKYDSHLMERLHESWIRRGLTRTSTTSIDLNFSYAAVKQLEGKYFVRTV